MGKSCDRAEFEAALQQAEKMNKTTSSASQTAAQYGITQADNARRVLSHQRTLAAVESARREEREDAHKVRALGSASSSFLLFFDE
eukprot:SAG31_NODE_3008_length_4790_cov_327.591132_6_plen_86_part_00